MLKSENSVFWYTVCNLGTGLKTVWVLVTWFQCRQGYRKKDLDLPILAKMHSEKNLKEQKSSNGKYDCVCV